MGVLPTVGHGVRSTTMRVSELSLTCSLYSLSHRRQKGNGKREFRGTGGKLIFRAPPMSHAPEFPLPLPLLTSAMHAQATLFLVPWDASKLDHATTLLFCSIPLLSSNLSTPTQTTPHKYLHLLIYQFITLTTKSFKTEWFVDTLWMSIFTKKFKENSLNLLK